MSLRHLFAWTTAAAVASGAAAQPASPIDTVTISGEHFSLDRGNSDWNEAAISFGRTWSQRQRIELGLARTRRFGLDDDQLRASGSVPIGDRVTLSLDGTSSATHRVLPRSSLGAAAQLEFAPGWLAHAGLRHTAYTDASVDAARLGIERYVGNYSFLAAWSPARALGQHTDSAELRTNWYYADNASVGVLLARGEEATQLGEGRIAVADVRAAALLGRHPLGQRLSLLWSASRTRQGSFYTRTGASLGLAYAF